MIGSFSTEVGLLAIWDSASFAHIKTDEDYKANFSSDKNISDLMNKGSVVVWGTGGEGVFKIDIRIDPQSDLTPEEKSMTEFKSENHKLVVSGDTVYVGSPEPVGSEELNALNAGYIAKVEGLIPGTYKVDIYFLFDRKVYDEQKPEFMDKTGFVVIIKEVFPNQEFPSVSEVPVLS